MKLFIVIRGAILRVVGQNEQNEIEMTQFMGETEKTLNISHVLMALEEADIPSDSSVTVLLDFPWVSLRTVNLPHFKRNRIKMVLVHELANEYPSDVDDINFDYYQTPLPEKRHHTVVYSTEKQYSEELNSFMISKKCTLSGMHPFPHLFEQKIYGLLQDLSLSYCLYFSAPSAVSVFKYREGALQEVSSISFSPDEGKEALEKKLDLDVHLSMLSETRSPAIYFYKEDESLVSFRKDPEDPEDPEYGDGEEIEFKENLNFQTLANLVKENAKSGRKLNLVRLDNAFFKNLFHARVFLRQSLYLIVLSVIIFLAGNLYSIHKNEANVAELQQKYQQLLKKYLPRNKNTDKALTTISGELADLKTDWESRQPFMSRRFHISNMIKDLSQLTNYDEKLVVNSFSYQGTKIIIKGRLENESRFSSITGYLGGIYSDYDLKTSKRTSGNITSFEITMTEKQINADEVAE